MTTLSRSDHAALRAMHRAARHPRLKAAIATYQHLRTRGVDHQEAVERAMEFIVEVTSTRKSN
jgi:hypothetical protein